MDKEQILDDIFNNDPLGILNVKAKSSSATNADERLISSFCEINKFYAEHNREPKAEISNITEYKLFVRLQELKEDKEKSEYLKEDDIHNLLGGKKKEINSLEDIFNDDSFDILDDDSEGLFDFKHTPKTDERAESDFVARRKPCRNFADYEEQFKQVQKELNCGERNLIDFREDNLTEGNYYLHNGVLMLLEKIDISKQEESFKSGKRVRKDGRTRCVFENGTESNMLYRSLAKILYINGKVVTEKDAVVNKNFENNFNNITDEDNEVGFIYILKSKSKEERITSIDNLYKIGYSQTTIEERIKNAEKEPTYLMAPVSIVSGFKCYNMNPQKLEQLLHNFFGNSCLELDVYDEKQKRHTPREWFIVSLAVIEKAVELIIEGKIIDYKFDYNKQGIVVK